MISAIAPGYLVGRLAKPPTNLPPLDEGRFSFDIPLKSLMNCHHAATQLRLLSHCHLLRFQMRLAVRPGDKVHIGYAFKDEQGNPQWRTNTVSPNERCLSGCHEWALSS